MSKENPFETLEKTMHTANTEISKIADEEKEDKIKNSNPISSNSNEENWIEKAFRPEFLKWADKYSKGDKARRLQLIHFYNGVYFIIIFAILSIISLNYFGLIISIGILIKYFLEYDYIKSHHLYGAENKSFIIKDGIDIIVKRRYYEEIFTISIAFIATLFASWFFILTSINFSVLIKIMLSSFIIISISSILIFKIHYIFKPKIVAFGKTRLQDNVYKWQ